MYNVFLFWTGRGTLVESFLLRVQHFYRTLLRCLKVLWSDRSAQDKSLPSMRKVNSIHHSWAIGWPASDWPFMTARLPEAGQNTVGLTNAFLVQLLTSSSLKKISSGHPLSFKMVPTSPLYLHSLPPLFLVSQIYRTPRKETSRELVRSIQPFPQPVSGPPSQRLPMGKRKIQSQVALTPNVLCEYLILLAA